MSIGPDARRWYLSKFGKSKNRIYTSKYYLPEESWPKKEVWWIQIPPEAIDRNMYDHVSIVCQKASSTNDFHLLRVPVKYFHEHLEKFHRIGEKISLYLSADQRKLFTEIRGVGNLNFSEFLVMTE